MDERFAQILCSGEVSRAWELNATLFFPPSMSERESESGLRALLSPSKPAYGPCDEDRQFGPPERQRHEYARVMMLRCGAAAAHLDVGLRLHRHLDLGTGVVSGRHGVHLALGT